MITESELEISDPTSSTSSTSLVHLINHEYRAYHVDWRRLVEARRDRQFFNELRPTALAWKVDDEDAYQNVLRQLRGACDRIVETYAYDRCVALLWLRSAHLTSGVRVLKVIQRRPGSTDAQGLDHVDFYAPHDSLDAVEAKLLDEPDLAWSIEARKVVAVSRWAALRFPGSTADAPLREAKLRTNSALAVTARELTYLADDLLADPK